MRESVPQKKDENLPVERKYPPKEQHRNWTN